MISSMQKPAWLNDAPSFMSSRTYRFLRVFVGVSLLLVIINFYALDFRSHVQRQASETLNRDEHIKIQNKTLDAASNSTLGFDSIQFINLPGRFDRLDAATLQAYLSGLDITEVPGVLADDIHEAGMPPTHRNELKKGEKGCWRAHANIWSQMLRDKTPAVLIIESDTAWDINVREIMRNLNEHFTYFLHQINSTRVHNAGFNARNAPEPSEPLPLDPDDPWYSQHWDLLSLGQCFENEANSDIRVVYPDEHVEPGKEYFGETLGHERVVRKSGGIVCTTAYAVSQTGAAKLLLRGAVDLDNPVDLLMRRLIISDDLLTYSVMPTVFAQWEYKNDIGMDERGANSDINGEERDQEDINMEGWDEVKNTGSVWMTKDFHPDVAFTDMALERAWSMIMPHAELEKSQYDESSGN